MVLRRACTCRTYITSSLISFLVSITQLHTVKQAVALDKILAASATAFYMYLISYTCVLVTRYSDTTAVVVRGI